MRNKVLAEAKRLHDLGFGIHWLHNKSKRPVESGWTSGPRKTWKELTSTYNDKYNVGVRLGEVSKIGKNFLGVIDVDVKSKDVKHAREVKVALGRLTSNQKLPEVKSGRGNGSKHYYILTPEPLTPFKLETSKDIVRVHMPSVAPSKKERAALKQDELDAGIRLRPAWEIGIMGQGQQVVLPPSIHPDSGKNYAWQEDFDPVVASEFDPSVLKIKQVEPSVFKDIKVADIVTDLKKPTFSFEIEDVDLLSVKTSDKIIDMILTGAGVEDRSASLLPVSSALLRAGLTQNQILTVLTDPENYLGQVGYNHAQTKNRIRAAAWVYKYTLKKAIEDNSGEKLFRDLPEEKELSFDEMTDDAEELDKNAWMLELDITDKDVYRATLKNTVSILEHEIGVDCVKRDLFAYRDFYTRETPWGGVSGTAIVDDDIPKIKLWLAKNWGFEPSAVVVGDALTVIATNNAFDPALDWLHGLPEWDGIDRLDTWLKNHFHAKGHEDYLAQVFRKWMVAMIMRIEQPGSKFDWMPIFEGPQGAGKSSFGRILVGDKYFLDWLPDLANKDSALALQGVWSVEMGELASFRKNEIETVKAFITRTVDKVRPPYGQRWLESPRRCVFFGTTNFETYLRDESGNRRFKPLKVGKLDFEQLIKDRDQLFAEALSIWNTGFETEKTLDITGDARVYELQIQGEKMVADDSVLMAEFLRIFFKKEAENDDQETAFNFERFSLHDLFDISKNGMGTPPLKNWKYDTRNAMFAGKALKNLGGEKRKLNGNIYWRVRKP